MALVTQQPPTQTLQMKVKGLWTNANELSEAPDGALSIADNIVISKDSIAECRRGFNFLPFALPNSADVADKLGEFQNTLLVHYNDATSGTNNDKLAYYSNSTGINVYSGSYQHPDPLMARMRFAESNQNIYFTTANGVYKNDLITNNPVLAGMPQGLDVAATASASASGFQNNNSEVAYRIVWGITDANNNLILGAPSQRAIISNVSGSVQNVSLQITIPAGITTKHFYQVYRSDQSLGIVAQAYLTIQDITYTANPNGYAGTAGNSITVSYTTGGTAGSEVVTVSGTAISIKIQSGTSTASQVLAAFNNSAPALALCSASITGVNTNVQTAPASGTLSGGSVTLSVPDDSMQLVYEANPTSSQISAKSITVIDSTPDSLRGAALYTNSTQQGILQANTRPPFAHDMALFQTCMFYANVQTQQQMFLTVLAVGGSGGIQSGDTITIAGTTYTAGSSENVSTLTYHLVTSGSPAQNINDTTLSLIRVINQNTTNTAVYAYYLSSANGLPGEMLIQARTLGTSAFSITGTGTLSAFNPVVPTSGTTLSSTNTTNLNGLMYSTAGEPEAVPSLNILYPGSASKRILRILPSRNSLFILKEDGVFRCTGTAGNFSIDTIDATVILLAPESAVTLNNQIFCLTTQGIVAVSDNGAQILSRPIENQFVQLEGAGLSPLQYYSFGVSYESERQYVIWTITASSDTYATQAFIYNYVTKTWTRSTRQQTFGLVMKADNKMYLTNPANSQISQERKSFTYTDYSDEAYPVTLSAYSGYTVTLSDVGNLGIGDIIYQSLTNAATVTSINPATRVVTLNVAITSWTIGSASILKSIPCLIEWLPNAAGNPGYYRHWRETVIIFKQNVFNNASINFYSEISASIDMVPIAGSAAGGWGQFPWGSQPWGDVIRSNPFRTYVPLNKQYCDLLSIQFQCQNAWAQFAIEGLSCIMGTVGERMTT
jgi:hypothetical protein